MAAIKKRSLVDQVYEALRRDIIMLRRLLGSKLNVNELQEELGGELYPHSGSGEPSSARGAGGLQK